MSSRVHPKYETKVRVKNWPCFERGLIQRGDVTVWMTPLTRANLDDASLGHELIDVVEGDTSNFTADAAYDTIALYDAVVPGVRFPRVTQHARPG